jgi:hypothetical protein
MASVTLGLEALLALSTLLGCASSDAPSISAPGGVAGASGGAGTSAAAGASGGAGVGASSGAAGEANAGAAGSDNSVQWPTAYNPDCAPTPSSGWHHAGEDCVQCHSGSGSASSMSFALAGTVWADGGATAAAHVQVGVTGFSGNPGAFFYGCSAANGNFWVYGGPSTAVPWGEATVVLRSATGQIVKPKHGQAGCNSCHGASLPIVGP